LSSLDSDTYTKINDVRVEEITLKSPQGGNMDLSGLCVHLDLFEDIRYPFLRGQMKVVDALSVRTHFPLAGGETVVVRYRTPGIGSKMVKVEMVITSMTGRTKTQDDRSEIYELNLKSKNAILNEIQRVQGSYSGTISSMVSKIIDEYFPGSEYRVEKTKDTYKYTIPNLKPIDAIMWLMRKAKSAQPPHDSDYVFYETVDSFVFASLGFLSQQNHVKQYHSKVANVDDGKDNDKKNFLRIQDIEVGGDFNLDDDLKNSGIASRLITHDLTYKKISYDSFNYIKDFDQSSHIHKNRKYPVEGGLVYVSNGPSYLLPKQNLNHGELYDKNFDFEDYYLKSLSSKQMWRSRSLLISASGDSTLRAGMKVELELPANQPNKQNDSDWYDKYASGYYLIASIRHGILTTSTKEYMNDITLVRDSVPSAVPDQKKFLGSSQNNDNNDGTLTT
jgi:hypothetical protein